MTRIVWPIEIEICQSSIVINVDKLAVVLRSTLNRWHIRCIRYASVTCCNGSVEYLHNFQTSDISNIFTTITVTYICRIDYFMICCLLQVLRIRGVARECDARRAGLRSLAPRVAATMRALRSARTAALLLTTAAIFTFADASTAVISKYSFQVIRMALFNKKLVCCRSNVSICTQNTLHQPFNSTMLDMSLSHFKHV